MKKILSHLIVFSALGLIFLTSCSRFTVIPVTDNMEPPKSGGVFYALPRNIVVVEIIVTETEKIRGPYAQFAGKYLGLSNVQLTNSKSYELNDIKIHAFAEADPDNFYYILPGNWKQNKRLWVELSESGLVKTINEKPEITLDDKIETISELGSEDYSKTFKYFVDANVYEKTDTIIEKVNLDSLTIEKKILRKQLVEKSLEQKAGEAANFIMKLKENRINLITGFQEIPYEKGTVEYMYSELEKLENEYMKLFTGLTVTHTLKYRFNYIPESNVFTATKPLFKFSQTFGVLKEDNENGELVYIEIDRARNTKKLEKIVTPKPDSKEKNHGYYYRIPEFAKFTIKQGMNLKAEANLIIGQFGVVSYLPARKSKIQFYPETGAIKKIVLE